MTNIKFDAFTKGYLACALWLADECDDATIYDLAPEALEKVKADCAKFQADNSEDLFVYYDERDSEHAGHDFWLTRNHHGAGFWARDGISQDVLDRLTAASHQYRELDPYLGDDGLVRFM